MDSVLRVMLCLILTLTIAVDIHAGEATPTIPQEAPTGITFVPSDSFNMQLDELISPTYAITSIKPLVHNWFGGLFTNLPLDQEVTIGLSMAGNDSLGNKADVSKWVGLHPVMTYADPTKYASYECFQREGTHWISADPFKSTADRLAGDGDVPVQQAVSATVADQFLSADKQSWCPWREVDSAEALPNLNIFRIKQQFSASTASLALRIPFTYTYWQAFVTKLQQAKLPGVSIDEIGTTPEQRKLYVIRLDDPATKLPASALHTVLVIGKEHASEPAGSWAAYGMLLHLLGESAEAKALRKDATWLFIPIEDPDGSAHGEYSRITESFRKPNDPATPPEVFAYAKYFVAYVNAGRTIDIALSLHNLEANESPHLFCPIAQSKYREVVFAFNKKLFQLVGQEGYSTGQSDQPWEFGWSYFRLFGWCDLHFGTLPIALEVNDRFPADPLSLQRLQHLGALIGDALGQWCESDAGQQWHRMARSRLDEREQKRNAYLQQAEHRTDRHAKYNLLMLGY